MKHPLPAALLCAASFLAPALAAAHPVTVDGAAGEWLVRLPNTDNLGLVARNAQGLGELIFRDALGDTRTDIATPEVVADITAFQVTGDATGVGFLVRRAPGVVLAGAPIQLQIAIDLDRVAGSGQEFFAGFADTKVANGARWERLVQTLFGSGGQAQVVDTGFNQVAAVTAAQGAAGDVEIFVPWAALGLNGPPSAPLRLTVAAFRAQNDDLTVDVGGAMFSNALDALTDYGDPVAAVFPNTYAEVQDLIVDDSLDVHFGPAGEVYAPLVIERFLPNAIAGNSDEWYVLQNVSPAALDLAGYKLGDEETPDGSEAMYTLPTFTLAPGATFTVARALTAFQAFYGLLPDAEVPPSASVAVPDLTVFTPWTNGASLVNLQLANGGDELLLLDPTNTLLDVVTYGSATYAGITTKTPAPPGDNALVRKVAGTDTDDCQVDFTATGPTCQNDAQCGGGCQGCTLYLCAPKAQGAPCPDGNPCNGDELCDGAGTCAAGVGPACDDQSACTADSCDMVNGCQHAPVAAGVACSDGDACNGLETCDALGACQSGAPLDCDDQNPCTADDCDSVGACAHAPVADGTSCADADVCNGDEMCAAGACVSGGPLTCDDQDPCTDDACDPVTGCSFPDAPTGTPCDDGDSCTEQDACAMGQCAGVDTCGTGGAGGAGSGGGGGAGTGGTGTGGGSTGAGGSGTTTSGTGSGEGGSSATGGGTAEDSGCGCRVVSGSEGDRPWLLGLSLVGLAALRRRRRD